MKREKVNKNLLAQKRNKNNPDRDEFYTTKHTAELMMKYVDKTQLADMRICCNCDSPESEIYKLLKDKFQEWKLKSLTATCYDRNGGKGKKTVFDGLNETISDLQGNGDFRSEECLDILDDNDIIITNPPFTLLKDWLRLVIAHKKKYVVIANALSLTNPKMVALLCPSSIVYDFRGNESWYLYDGKEVHVSAQVFSNLAECTRIVHSGAGMSFKYADGYRRKEPHRTFAELKAQNKIKFLDDGTLNVRNFVDTPIDYEGIMALPSTMPYIQGFFDNFDMLDYKPGVVKGKSTYYKTFCRWKRG